MLVELAVTPIVLGLTDVDVRVPFPVDADPALTAVVVVALTEVEVEIGSVVFGESCDELSVPS